MKIGFLTDTHFPQMSEVVTSIKTLKNKLEKHGHEMYIFTTIDPNATGLEEDVIRMLGVPFVSFKDRRVVVRGMWHVHLTAKELELDLIHTHIGFGAGILEKMAGKKMKILAIHTYHTTYEDYLYYTVEGKVVRPSHVKFSSGAFTDHTTDAVYPSERVIEKLRDYGVTVSMRIIPIRIEINKLLHPDITEEMITGTCQ